MKKFVAALSALTLFASAGAGVAGGMNDAIVDNTVIPAGGSSSAFPIWAAFVPVAVCALACGNGGTGGTGGTEEEED